MAYQWCSAISEKIREDGGDELTSEGLPRLQYSIDFVHLLSNSLAIAFRHIGSNSFPSIHLPHTHHHEWMLDAIFTTENDDLIADAMCVWIVDQKVTPPGSCTRRLLKLTERDRLFSPRLRLTIFLAVQQLLDRELKATGLEFVHLLNNLEFGVDDTGGEDWRLLGLVTGVLQSSVGQGYLSSHYWLLLRSLIFMGPSSHPGIVVNEGVVMKSLEEAQDWDKLETWMLFVWWSWCSRSREGDIERITLTLFRQRPSAVPKFELLYEKCRRPNSHCLFNVHKDEFRRICDQARAEQPFLESLS
jgi:hypothetical protein